MPPAAILDIDGTLVDTNYHHAIAWFRAFRRHGEVLPVWRIHRHIGMGGDHLVRSLCGDAVEEQKGDDVRAAEARARPRMRGDGQGGRHRGRLRDTPLGDGEAARELPRQA